MLAERKTAWEERQGTVDYYDQKAELPGLKAGDRPALQQVPSQILQDLVLRLKNAFDVFFRRMQADEAPGYPRFRGPGRYDSLSFPQVPVGCALDATAKRLVVWKVGRIMVVLHRPLEGTPKTATIRRTATSKWFVTFGYEWAPTPLPPTGQAVGIDVGPKVFAMPSQGKEIENPRLFCAEEHAMAQAQRKHQAAVDAHKALHAALTQQVKEAHPNLDAQQVWHHVSRDPVEREAWQARLRRRRVVARTHERICWRRDNFTHQESRRLINTFDFLAVDFLAVEVLSVRQMMFDV